MAQITLLLIISGKRGKKLIGFSKQITVCFARIQRSSSSIFYPLISHPHIYFSRKGLLNSCSALLLTLAFFLKSCSLLRRVCVFSRFFTSMLLPIMPNPLSSFLPSFCLFWTMPWRISMSSLERMPPSILSQKYFLLFSFLGSFSQWLRHLLMFLRQWSQNLSNLNSDQLWQGTGSSSSAVIFFMKSIFLLIRLISSSFRFTDGQGSVFLRMLCTQGLVANSLLEVMDLCSADLEGVAISLSQVPSVLVSYLLMECDLAIF